MHISEDGNDFLLAMINDSKPDIYRGWRELDQSVTDGGGHGRA